MALIKCTECGKSFSDKAAACPECGCPTEHVLKASTSKEAIAKRAQSSEEATKTMLAEVEKARSKARSAESLFESRNRSIQMKASQTIDIFGGDATSRVVEIRSDARRACDDLYTSYQTLVGTLDGICRPLLSHSPGGQAIKAVSDYIRYLNDESEIESNFTASFNGSSLGNVANSMYVPSIENKMIQRFWESQYSASPYAAEYEKRRRQEAEEARKRREDERKQREEARQAEEKRKAEEKASAKANMDKIVSEGKSRTANYKVSLKSQADQELKVVQQQIADKLKELNQRKSETESALASLNPFQGSKKAVLRRELQRLTLLIEKLSSPAIVENEKRKLRMITDDAANLYQQDMDSYLAARFPYWKNFGSAKRPGSNQNEYSEDPSAAQKAIPAVPDVKAPFDQHRS